MKFNFFSKKPIVPEVLLALRWKFPDELDVKVSKSEDGGFIAKIKNLPGCITQAETGQELYEMVNDAVYTYLDIPEEYIPYVPSFTPPERVRKEYNIKIKEGTFVFQRV